MIDALTVLAHAAQKSAQQLQHKNSKDWISPRSQEVKKNCSNLYQKLHTHTRCVFEYDSLFYIPKLVPYQHGFVCSDQSSSCRSSAIVWGYLQKGREQLFSRYMRAPRQKGWDRAEQIWKPICHVSHIIRTDQKCKSSFSFLTWDLLTLKKKKKKVFCSHNQITLHSHIPLILPKSFQDPVKIWLLSTFRYLKLTSSKLQLLSLFLDLPPSLLI